MKYLLYICIVSVAALILYFGVFNGSEKPLSNNQQGGQRTDEIPQTQWETQTDEQPPVTIKITPIELGRDAKTWKFAVVFDAHAGSLDDDPAKVATLVDDKGNVYESFAWEGPGAGGHHREGVLIFNPINPAPAYVELKIEDVGGVPRRLFKWIIQ